MMIICDDNYPKILDDILDFLSDGDVELIFVEDEEMQRLNKTYRKIDKSTDVLSFPLQNFSFLNSLGSIVINTNLTKQVSKQLNHTENEEIALLFIHGLLHLLGFDHEIDNGEMREKEEEIIKNFNLPKSLIIRNS